MKVTEQYFTLNNQRYEMDCKIYLPESEEISRIILGVHGFAGDKESSALTALAEAFAPYNIALVSFDLPAHGKSKEAEESLTISNCMKDILFMAEYCRKNYPNADKYMFSTSFGGYLTLLCAENLKDFKIILRAPAVTMPEHILLDILNMSAQEFKEKENVNCGFERAMALPYSFYEDLLAHSLMNREYDSPMLIIHGDKDDVVPHEDILSFCQSRNTFQLAVIKGADHRFKKPGEMEAIIKEADNFWKIIR